MNGSEPVPIDLAFRVWAEPPGGWPRRHRPATRLARPARQALVFDTETVNPFQDLLVLCWRRLVEGICVEEGFAYPDDLPDRDPTGFQCLTDYVAEHRPSLPPGYSSPGGRRIQLWSLSRWLEKRLWPAARRGDLVGFVLPFDLTRLAPYWTQARSRQYKGGFSLGIWGSCDTEGHWQDRYGRPRLLIRHLGDRRAFLGWGSVPRDCPVPQGRLVDAATTHYVLTGEHQSLEGACQAWGINFHKEPVTYGEISPDLLDYAREDVRATAVLYLAQQSELARHQGISLEAHRLYSPATAAARHLEAMGITPPLERFDDLPRWVLGAAMAASLAGRAEARISRTELPVGMLDVSSMYALASANLGTWAVWTADRLEVIDVTPEMVELCQDPNLLERLRDPRIHRHLGITLVEIQPQGDPLIHRGRYQERRFRLASNPLWSDGPGWWFWPDLLDAVLRGHQIPRILRAVRLVPRGCQSGLQKIQLRGGTEFDPRTDDPFLALVRLRREAAMEGDRHRANGFRVLASSLASGLPAQFNALPAGKPREMNLYGPSGHLGRREIPGDRIEQPGPYCFPPIAGVTTAWARLMMGLMERLITDRGGTLAFGDTDAWAVAATPEGGLIPCQGGPEHLPDGREAVPALSFPQISEILEWFRPLNPFTDESPWRIQHDSLSEPLWAYVLAQKIYILYRPDADGGIQVVKASELGLGGVFLDPTARDSETPNLLGGRYRWTEEALAWLVCQHRERAETAGGISEGLAASPGSPVPASGPEGLGDTSLWPPGAAEAEPARPDWFQAPALMRVTVSTPGHWNWFGGDRIRPYTFLLLGHQDHWLQASPDLRPFAPYHRDPSHWLDLEWRDRQTGKSLAVLREPLEEGYSTFPREVDLARIGRKVERLMGSREHSALAPNREEMGTPGEGLLMRPPVRGDQSSWSFIGKETPILHLEALLGLIPSERVLIRYPTCHNCGRLLEGRQRRWCRDACRKAWRRAHPPRICQGPGHTHLLPPGRTRWCSDACEKQARRYRALRKRTEAKGGKLCDLAGCRSELYGIPSEFCPDHQHDWQREEAEPAWRGECRSCGAILVGIPRSACPEHEEEEP